MKRFLLLAIAALAAMASSACSDSSDGPTLNSLTIEPASLKLEVGSTDVLAVRLDPATFEGSFVWKSSDPAVATVEDGVVTAVAVGNATIAVTCAGLVAECAVTVVPVPVMNLDRTELSIYPGVVETLTASFEPADAAGTVEWTSSNPSVVTVDGGTVTAVAVGEATVTATCGRMKAECKVVVTPIFQLAVRDITSSSFVVTTDPRDPEAYYLYGATYKSLWETSSADLLTSLVDEIKSYLNYYTIEELIAEDVISRGATSYKFELVEASTDFVGYAVKFDLATLSIVGDVETVAFRTLDVVPSDNRFTISFDASTGIISVKTTNKDYWYWALLTDSGMAKYASPEEAYQASLEESMASGYFAYLVSSGDEDIDLKLEMVEGKGLHLLVAGWNGGVSTKIIDYVFDYTPSASSQAPARSLSRTAAVDKARTAAAPVKRLVR